MTALTVHSPIGCYPITVGRGLLAHADNYFQLNRKVTVVTDSGVPPQYAKTVAGLCREARIFTFPAGEDRKSMETLSRLLSFMCESGMERSDCCVAVGGGVVGDLAGLAASLYMRGIDFFNIPTTLLSQVDSSVGGKTAVNFGGYKNTVGTFYSPKAVLIDTDTLSTLSDRQLSNGLAESVKMAITSDASLFRSLEQYAKQVQSTGGSLFSGKDASDFLEDVIRASLKIKISVVEADCKEAGLRRILNFGHTYGHGVEASAENHSLLHGECVAIGMIPMCAPSIRNRVRNLLEACNLPTVYTGDREAALSCVAHDKKCVSGFVNAVLADEIGSCRIEKMTVSEFCERIRNS